MPQKPTLLIVDDETNVLFTLKLVLEEDGYEITTANSCAEALKLIHNSHRFDAILTDLRMEQEDIGLELAEAAAKLRPRPVIMIFTGYGSVQNARGALGIQVDYFALKPLDLDDLKNALHRLLVWRGQARRGRA
jgi:two-component system response regulator GlrR